MTPQAARIDFTGGRSTRKAAGETARLTRAFNSALSAWRNMAWLEEKQHARDAVGGIYKSGSRSSNIMATGSRTGWSPPPPRTLGSLRPHDDGGGKSELRRVVCRITSGTLALRPADGKCHREYTAATLGSR